MQLAALARVFAEVQKAGSAWAAQTGTAPIRGASYPSHRSQ